MPVMSAPCPPPAAAPSVTRAGSIVGNAVEGMFAKMVSGSSASIEECEAIVAKSACETPAPRRRRSSSFKKKGKKKEMDRRDRASGGGVRREPVADLDFADELEAPADLLDYGSLRMAGAKSSNRGKLRPASRKEMYLELLTELNVQVSFDVVQTIRVAVNGALLQCSSHYLPTVYNHRPMTISRTFSPPKSVSMCHLMVSSIHCLCSYATLT